MKMIFLFNTEEDFCGNRSGVQRCFNGGQCTNIGDGYRCACVTGFTGVQCESNIDDCSNDSCLNGATCRDFINGFKCHCAEGYTGIGYIVDDSIEMML